jgi:hypothetical protein
VKPGRRHHASTRAAVFLTAAALVGALPAAPACTVVSGWSDLQSGLARDGSATTSATGTTTGSTSATTSATAAPDAAAPPDGSAPGDPAPTDLPSCPPFGSQSSCACTGACQADCTGKPGCQFVVQGFASASLDCSAGACTYWCLGGNCDGDCTGGGCVVHCRPGAFCSFDCTGGNCVFECEGGSCANHCSGGGCKTQ